MIIILSVILVFDFNNREIANSMEAVMFKFNWNKLEKYECSHKGDFILFGAAVRDLKDGGFFMKRYGFNTCSTCYPDLLEKITETIDCLKIKENICSDPECQDLKGNCRIIIWYQNRVYRVYHFCSKECIDNLERKLKNLSPK